MFKVFQEAHNMKIIRNEDTVFVMMIYLSDSFNMIGNKSVRQLSFEILFDIMKLNKYLVLTPNF